MRAERARGHDPARGAGADERDRLLARLLRAHHAAVRAQDEELLDAAALALLLELRHGVVHERLQVGVEHGRRGALVLAPARQHLVRERDANVGPELLDDLPRAQLVLGVHEREEVGDRDRGNTVRIAQALDLLAQPRLVERHEHGAVAQHALGNAHAARPRHEVPRLHPVQIEVIRPRDTLDAQDVAEAVRRQQRDVGALALDEGVRRHRRAVDEVRDLVRVETRLGERVEDGLRRLRRRGEHLGHADLARLLVERDKIGEGAAGVDAGSDAHRKPPPGGVAASLRSAQEACQTPSSG